ncbi:RidA family protein [Chitinasiproducens palmae]|uniref:Enamine deaminase RidA, house cleaning of reactive enamine intermediates, YjgF/YER057c/UK114 family n=1 Tax=Chitinasiproducens palmae TaxID=1770053 RepID=A0A1H2PMZ2_9BURK|nr:RidA family protein [Chitinasiproducens palmae]SDV48030.1 Enamine deaminase RidA, house cleaning of reactive enamine intermediates, YjgF/YER057c/UK114 family [Chitinasiproducens palmae]
MSTAIERIGTTPRMSKIVRHAGIVYLCGQTAVGASTPDIAAQTTEALARVDALLTEAGSSRARILSAIIHLKDIAQFGEMNTVWEAWLPPGAAPARTTVQASLAAADLLFEVTVTAAVD